MADELGALAISKLEAHKAATRGFVELLLSALVSKGSLDARLLLERLYFVQSRFPGLQPSDGPVQNAIAQDIVEAFRTYIEAAEAAVAPKKCP